MPENLCKWDAERIGKKLKKYRKLTQSPRYTCSKCGQSAITKDVLCKPIKRKD